jgi:AAA family ATP:ADP antiporter
MNKSNENNIEENKKSTLAKLRTFIINTENSEETKLALLLGSIFVCIIYIYTVSRLLKDNLVTARLGAEVIPLMKNIVAVSTFLFGIIFVLGTLKFNRRQLFNITVVFFIIFFAVFGFVIYPNSATYLLSDGTVNSILKWLGGATGSFFCWSKIIKMSLGGVGLGTFVSLGDFKTNKIIKNIINYTLVIFGIYSLLFYFSGPKLASSISIRIFIDVLKHWPYALYYILSEMVGAFFVGALFWNFANYQVNLSEAKRIYPFVVLIGQVGQIGAGYLTKFFSSSSSLVGVVSATTVLSGLLVLFIHEYILRTMNREVVVVNKKKKQKASFMDSIKAMSSSSIVLLTSSIILFYGITCNILETYWKGSLNDLAKKLFPSSKELARAYFSSTQSTMIIWVGYLSVITALLSGFLMKTMGWRFSALITPVTVAVGTCCFFGLTLFNDITGAGGLEILKIAMIMGMIVLVFVKATKYTIFDNTKEMLLLTLPEDIKSQAKVADSLSGRLGKTLGGQTLLVVQIIAGGITTLPVRIIIFILMLLFALIWTFNVYTLAQLEQKAEQNQ